MKKSLVLLSILAVLAQNAFAQESPALVFTQIERSPVNSAFAGAGAAFSQRVSYAGFANAAMLPYYKGTVDASAAFQYWTPELFPSAHFSAGAAYKPLPRLGIAVGYALENPQSYNVVTEPGVSDGTFYPKNHVLALGAGFGVTEQLSMGVNFRYARELPAPSVIFSGVSADLFAAWQFNPGFRVTAGVSTLGSKVVSGGESFGQPASAKIAVNWGAVFAESHALDLLADASYYFSGSFAAALGVQYAWDGLLFVRAGYRFASPYCPLPGHLALGFGICYQGFSLDASYLTASPSVGNSFNIGLSYGF